MTFSRILFFAFRFIRSKFWQFFFVFLGTALGSALFLTFLTVGDGIKRSLQQSFSVDDSIVSVQAHPSSPVVFDESLRSKILDSDAVESVYIESTQVIPFTFLVPLPLVDDLRLDLYFLRGIETSVFSPESNPFDSSTSHSEGFIPVVLNPLSLDLINSLLSGFLNDVRLSKDLFLGKTVSVEIGNSAFLPEMNHSVSVEKKFVVTGFSPLAPLVGVMIPHEHYRQILSEVHIASSAISRFHLHLHPGFFPADIDSFVRDNGLVVMDKEKTSKKLFQMTSAVHFTLLFCSGALLFLTFLFLFAVLQGVLWEQKKNIGILQAMGASSFTVGMLFGLQGFGVLVVGTLLGVGISWGGLVFLEWWWKMAVSVQLFPADIFQIDFLLSGIVFLGIIILGSIPILLSLYRSFRRSVLSNILDLS